MIWIAIILWAVIGIFAIIYREDDTDKPNLVPSDWFYYFPAMIVFWVIGRIVLKSDR